MNELTAFEDLNPFSDSQFVTGESGADFKQDNFPGRMQGLAVDLKELKLITNNGLELDILSVYDGIIIKEGLYNTFVSGIIKINDSVGGLEKFALRGGERLTMKICKPGTDEVIIWRQDLIVTKISAAAFDVINNRTSYMLSFSPRSQINSVRKNVYKSYNNLPISNIVLNLYKNITPNKLFIEDPGVTLTSPFQCGGKMPHEVIFEMAKRACSKKRFFVFFERFIPVYGTDQSTQESFASSHYFGSIEKLIEDSEISGIKTIRFVQNKEGSVEPNFIRAFSMMRDESFTHLNATRRGFYKTEFSSIDLIKRKSKNTNVGYLENFGKTIYNNKLVDEDNIFGAFNKSIGETPGKKVFVSSMNESVNRENWLPHEFIRRIATTYFRIQIKVSGGTNNIDLGHVVNFLTPSSSQKNLEVQNPYLRFDPVHSGKYVVTGVTHTIREGQYLKILELSRESTPYNYRDIENIDLINESN